MKEYKEPESSEHGAHSEGGGAAHGSHGAGEHDEHGSDSSNTVDHSLPPSETNLLTSPSSEDGGSPHQQGLPENEGETEQEHAESAAKGFPIIRIELEQEVLSFKKHEVLAFATDAEGREHPVPLYRSISSEAVLFGNLADLPKPGPYRTQARLKVKKKLGLEQQYAGPWLSFERPEVVSIHPITPIEQAPPKQVSVLLPFSVVSFFNLLVGGVLGVFLKRKAGPVQSESITFSYPDDLEVTVCELEQIAKESQIALDDPRLSRGTDSVSDDSTPRESGGGAQTVE